MTERRVRLARTQTVIRVIRSHALIAIGSFVLLGNASLGWAQRWQKVELAVHVHTKISTGSLTPEEVMGQAKAAKLDGVVFTDSLRRRWEYGFWPLRGLIKKTVNQPSVLNSGAQAYLEKIGKLNNANQLAIAGIEAAPFYYWRRSPFDKQVGEIRGWNQHLLVFGLDKPELLERLPLDAFNPYQGDQGAKPYQAFIDAATAAGGVVFWAHPFVKHEGSHGGILDFTDAYPHLLQETEGFQGFAITYLGYLSAVAPGGLWDELLLAYAHGRRSKPVWVIGESDWRGPQERAINMSVTDVLVNGQSPEAVLQAFREGRMWAKIRANASMAHLEEFGIMDEASAHSAVSGDHISVQGALSVRIVGRRGPNAQGKLKLTLIKDGMILFEDDVTEEVFIRQWPDHKPTGMSYYRLIVEDPAGVIYTNPIFVRPYNYCQGAGDLNKEDGACRQ